LGGSQGSGMKRRLGVALTSWCNTVSATLRTRIAVAHFLLETLLAYALQRAWKGESAFRSFILYGCNDLQFRINAVCRRTRTSVGSRQNPRRLDRLATRHTTLITGIRPYARYHVRQYALADKLHHVPRQSREAPTLDAVLCSATRHWWYVSKPSAR
jgi:hypothetical protein